MLCIDMVDGVLVISGGGSETGVRFDGGGGV